MHTDLKQGAVGDLVDRRYSRRELARVAALFGVGAAAVTTGGAAWALGGVRDTAGTIKMTTALPRTPEAFFPAMEERFNSLNVETALELFHERAIFVDQAGTVHHGKAAIGKQLKTYFDTGLKMTLRARHIFATGDTALSINDWSYDGKGKDGVAVKMSGSTSDVLRRCEDGVWRYVIDNPFGTGVGS